MRIIIKRFTVYYIRVLSESFSKRVLLPAVSIKVTWGRNRSYEKGRKLISCRFYGSCSVRVELRENVPSQTKYQFNNSMHNTVLVLLNSLYEKKSRTSRTADRS